MLFLYYFNWAGTPEEFSEFAERMKSIIKETEGAEFNGIFIPTSEWHYALIMKTTNYEKALQVMKTYIKKLDGQKLLWQKLNYFTHLKIGLERVNRSLCPRTRGNVL